VTGYPPTAASVEESQVDGVGHRLGAAGVRVQMVALSKAGFQMAASPELWTAGSKSTTPSQPLLLPRMNESYLARLRPPLIGFERGQRGTQELDARRVRGADHPGDAVDELLPARRLLLLRRR